MIFWEYTIISQLTNSTPKHSQFKLTFLLETSPRIFVPNKNGNLYVFFFENRNLYALSYPKKKKEIYMLSISWIPLSSKKLYIS